MRILFAGGQLAGRRCLEHLVQSGAEVVGVMAKETPEDEKTRFYSPYATARHLGIPIIKSFDDVEQYNPDTLLSVYYHRRIPKSVLDMMKNRINFHSGKLPEYRGCNINMWQIINGEDHGTVTAHIMEENFDAGEIVDEKTYPIGYSDTGGLVYIKATNSTVELFEEVYNDLRNGTIMTRKQQGTPHYYNKTLPNNGVIDWSWEPHLIDRFVRAFYFPPLTPAKTTIDNKTLYVVSGNVENGKYVITRGVFE